MQNRIRIAALRRPAACLAVAVCLVASLAAPLARSFDRVRVNVKNDSNYAIYHMYMSSTGDNRWGPDLLGDGILWPGSSAAVTAVPGQYDLKLVDEDDDECAIPNLGVYQNESWRITNSLLLVCEVFH